MGAAELRPVFSSPSSLPTCKCPVTFPWARRSGRCVPASRKCRAQVCSRLVGQDPAWRLLCSRGHREVSAGWEGTCSMADFLVKGNKKQRAGSSRQPVGSNNDINNNNKSLFPAQPCGAARVHFEDVIPSSRSIVWGSPGWFKLGSSTASTGGSSRALGTGCQTCLGSGGRPMGTTAQVSARPARVPTTAASPGPLQRATTRTPGSRQPLLVGQPLVTAATH